MVDEDKKEDDLMRGPMLKEFACRHNNITHEPK